VLVEDHPEESNGLKQTYELQLRSLSAPHCVYNELFESRVEFSQVSFGKPGLSFQSGRDDAFVWPSITRVGREAAQLAQQRQGSEGTTGISSPRRYLWDEERYAPGWRFNGKQEPMATAAPLTTLLNDEGVPLSALQLAERLPVFAAHYSRSAVMTLMLTELLAQALMQINSVRPTGKNAECHRPAPPANSHPDIAFGDAETGTGNFPPPHAGGDWPGVESHGLAPAGRTVRRQANPLPRSAGAHGMGRGDLRPDGLSVQRNPGELRRPYRRLFCQHGPTGSPFGSR
jgi:hypothetical protein